MQEIGNCFEDFIEWINENAHPSSVLYQRSWARTYFDAAVHGKDVIVNGRGKTYEVVWIDNILYASQVT